MFIQQISSEKTQFLRENPLTIRDAKEKIASTLGIYQYYVEVVNLEDGIIYESNRATQSLPKPLQIMVGNPDRKIPSYLITTEPDMIEQDANDEEPRLKMSCGHAITPDNLFGHMKNTLMCEVKPVVCCLTNGCHAEWDMREIVRKADMTDDERVFYECKISFNTVNQKSEITSECPECGQFCQRQIDVLPIRCTSCSKKKGVAFDFCWNCKSPWITNHQCSKRELEAFQKILNEAPRKRIDMSNIEGVPSKRLCPNASCRYLIEHLQACKTMTCTKCKTVFCFSCLKVAVNGQLQCGNYNQQCIVAPVQNVFEGN
ncbi:uncharacterized protein LOC134235525 [Saccostrea cucullata]|uniref:uncharacterized protein LOC134235525 n=1 Tax=Saccostrea cuccullata TaxID=36930 RepID=UPI002ECFEACC